MLLNTILGFVIPWIMAIIIFKDRKFLLWIALISSTLAFPTNELGFHQKMWNSYPFELEYISSIPLNLGLFALYPHYFITAIEKYRVSPIIAIGASGLLMMLAEYIGKLIGWVVYDNGWNLLFTYLSYLFDSIIIYLAYRKLKKVGYV